MKCHVALILVAVSGVIMSQPTASVAADAESGAFMRDWLVLGGIPVFDGEPDTTDYVRIAGAIDRDFLADAGGESAVQPTEGDTVAAADAEFTWQAAQSGADIVDLKEFCGDLSFVVAYAYAEFTAPEATTTVLGIGTDDEGKMDDDFVTVQLVEGVNRVLIKVANRELGWGFACRVLDAQALGEKLIDAAGEGRMDDVRVFTGHGADLTATRNGLTAAQVARIRGYADVAEELVSAGAPSTDPMPSPDDLVDSIFSEIVGEDMPGAAVLVARDGETLFERGYGLADVGNGVSVTPDTKFRIGSVSKQFTAAAILKLQEQGKLNVTDTLATFIDDYPRGDEVTLHHLLTHTSGIHNYTSNNDFLDLATVAVEPEDHIAYFKDNDYDFDPGEQWVYSNSGYYLLAYVVELVSEQSFGEFLREQFFAPLGMADTGLHDASTVLTHEAVGYTYEGGTVKKALNWDMSRALGAGNVYSTVRDLHTWNNAVFSHEALTEETMRAALTPARLNDGSVAEAMGEQYGYGWMTSDLRGMQVVSHTGGLHGFVAYLAWVPEKRMTVSVLHNAYLPIPRMAPLPLAHGAVQTYLWEELPTRASVSVADIDPSVFDRFAGHYLLAGMVRFEIKREGDAIHALAGPTPQVLVPMSETELLVEGTSVVLRFVLDEAGDLLHIEREEGGSITEAYPVEEEQEITVSADILEDYVGEYEYRAGMILTVSLEEGELFAQMTGQPRFGIFARSDTEFFWKVVEASVEFVRDESGAVEKVIHHQGPAVLHAPKIK